MDSLVLTVKLVSALKCDVTVKVFYIIPYCHDCLPVDADVMVFLSLNKWLFFLQQLIFVLHHPARTMERATMILITSDALVRLAGLGPLVK